MHTMRCCNAASPSALTEAAAAMQNGYMIGGVSTSVKVSKEQSIFEVFDLILLSRNRNQTSLFLGPHRWQTLPLSLPNTELLLQDQLFLPVLDHLVQQRVIESASENSLQT
jgi:hypothetical protein